MTTRQSRGAIFLMGVLFPTAVALGDGTILRRWNRDAKDADIFQPTQKVYIHTNGVQERLVIQTKYTGPAEEMVWLIPVPAQPTVERGDPSWEQVPNGCLASPTVWLTIRHGGKLRTPGPHGSSGARG